MTSTKLDNRVSIVTGAGSGLGRAIAELFAAEGAKVAVVDRDGHAASEVASEIYSAGGQALAIPADVSDAAQVDSAVATTLTTFGRIHVLCNSTVLVPSESLLETTDEDWDRSFDVNAKGTFLCCRAVVPHLIDSGGGSIINIASLAALAGQPRFAANSASMGAVLSLTRTVAVDFGRHGVRANVICPGMVATSMTDSGLHNRRTADEEVAVRRTAEPHQLGRLDTADEVAQSALFLASGGASFVTGVTLPVEGVLTTQSQA